MDTSSKVTDKSEKKYQGKRSRPRDRPGLKVADKVLKVTMNDILKMEEFKGEPNCYTKKEPSGHFRTVKYNILH